MEAQLDPKTWEGEVTELRGHEDLLAESHELCERTFASKQEAFAAGLSLGQMSVFERPEQGD